MEKKETSQASAEPAVATAMAFFHADGFIPAFQQASNFAGENGRLATMLDVVDARLATRPATNSDTYHVNDFPVPWERYFTTLTAEYLGYTKGGNKVLIVAHGVGPMSTLEGIKKAYAFHYQDKERNNRGGRITKQEFLDLESGKYGNVAVVDISSVTRMYEYPFRQILTEMDALCDPLLEARLGPRAEEYILYHGQLAREWHGWQKTFYPLEKLRHSLDFKNHLRWQHYRRQMHKRAARQYSDPFIIQNEDASNCPYVIWDNPQTRTWKTHYLDKDGLPIAHLISTGSLHHVSHSANGQNHESFVIDISCHEWYNGVRLVGVQGEGMVKNIQLGPDPDQLLRQHWQKLMKPVTKSVFPAGFFTLMKFGGQYFTMYSKEGESMDTWAPEFMVTKMEPVEDGPNMFRTTIGGGYPLFFRYGINEVQKIAPAGANAYLFTGEPEMDGQEHHKCPIAFYRVEPDTTQRVMKSKELGKNYQLMMSLMTNKAA
ncbi:MAG: hypothetical protein KGJ93_01505 [Patescibacteria group bacterium]|nr:hypothetical protein [Patescibacteria group bacterium]